MGLNELATFESLSQAFSDFGWKIDGGAFIRSDFMVYYDSKLDFIHDRQAHIRVWTQGLVVFCLAFDVRELPRDEEARAVAVAGTVSRYIGSVRDLVDP